MPSEETTLAVVEKTPAGKKPAQKRGRRGTFEASRTLESDFGMPEALELHVLHCLPGRITTFLKEGGYAERIGDKAPVNLSVVLQYVTKEVCYYWENCI